MASGGCKQQRPGIHHLPRLRTEDEHACPTLCSFPRPRPARPQASGHRRILCKGRPNHQATTSKEPEAGVPSPRGRHEKGQQSGAEDGLGWVARQPLLPSRAAHSPPLGAHLLPRPAPAHEGGSPDVTRLCLRAPARPGPPCSLAVHPQVPQRRDANTTHFSRGPMAGPSLPL